MDRMLPNSSIALWALFVCLWIGTPVFASSFDELWEKISARSVAESIDPFHEKFGVTASYLNRGDGGSLYQEADLQFRYGFSTGLSVNFELPLILSEILPTPDGALAPRIGGGAYGPYGHPIAELRLRLVGDAFEYFGVGLGVGFPLETDAQAGNSQYAPWLLPITALGRFESGPVAWSVRATDAFSFPVSSTQRIEENFKNSNFLDFDIEAAVFSRSRYSPFCGWNESLPETTVLGNVHGAAGYTKAGGPTTLDRTRIFFAGVRATPFTSSIVFKLQGDYLAINPNDDASVEIEGSMTWNL